MSLLSETAKLEALVFAVPWSEADILAFCKAGDFLLIQVLLPGSGSEGGSAPHRNLRATTIDELTAENGPGRADAYLLARQQAADGILEIIRIGTRPEARRKGLAAKLIAECEKASNGRLLLEVSERNHAAVGLYKRAGFQIIHRRPDYYSDGSAAWIMEKPRPGGGAQTGA